MSLSSFKPLDLDLLFFLALTATKKKNNDDDDDDKAKDKSIILNDMSQIKKNKIWLDKISRVALS